MIDVMHDAGRKNPNGSDQRWVVSFATLAEARRHLRAIASGRMRDPFGDPWPPCRAWIVGGFDAS